MAFFIADFTYNDAKNANIGHMFFKFNCRYNLCIFCKKNFNFYSKSKTIEELFSELEN